MVKNQCPHPVCRLGRNITNKMDNENQVVWANKSYCLACGKRVS